MNLRDLIINDIKKLFLRANALQYTLVIGVVIFLLLLLFILYFNFNKLFSLRTDTLINQIQNQENAFFYPEDYPQFSSINRNWGAYQVKTIKLNKEAKTDVNSIIETSKSAFINYKWENLGLPQLYIENDLSSLQISGKTILEGEFYVPQSKIRTTSVASKIYEGPSLNSLQLKSSTAQLPMFPLEKMDFTEWQDFSQDSLISFKSDFDFSNSFNSKSVAVISDLTLHLWNNRFNGQIKILSKKKIVVHESAQLNDIMLIAPVIEFKDSFSGSVHAIARDSIYLSKNVILSYPSSLTITNDATTSPLITLGENSRVEGIIHQFYHEIGKSNFSQLIISPNSLVKGVVYNKNNTVLKGTIDGSLFTKTLLAYEKGSIYRNFIIDGRLIKSDWLKVLADDSNIENKQMQPVKWLY